MIAFLIGGEGRFMDAMINKLNKDGHRVYLLTGTKNSHTSYQKVFEKYNFEYDSDSIREILVSANPDIVIDCIGFSQPQVKKVVADYSGTFFEIDQLNDSQINSFFYKNAHIYDALWYNCVDLSHIEILRMAKKNGIKRVIIHSHSSSMIVSGKIKKLYHLGRHYLHRVIVKKYATDYWACSDLSLIHI